jgi:hypothetical protein
METIKQMKVAALTQHGERAFSWKQQKSDQPYSPSRVFVDFGEDVWTHLANRRSRDYNTLRPLVLEKLKSMGIPVTKLRWSRYAGCSMCPCSGGFIIEGENGKDYWAKIETVDLELALA